MCSVTSKNSPWFFSFRRTRKKKKKKKKNNWSKGSDFDSVLLYMTQYYNSVFSFISFYFAPNQKRYTFADNIAEHISCYYICNWVFFGIFFLTFYQITITFLPSYLISKRYVPRARADKVYVTFMFLNKNYYLNYAIKRLHIQI